MRCGLFVLSFLGLWTGYAIAAAPTETNEGDLLRILIQSQEASIGKNFDLAITHCSNAKAFAARFDRNEYWLGLIEVCYADIARIRVDRINACAGYQRAIAHLNKAASRYRADAKSEIESTRKNITIAGC